MLYFKTDASYAQISKETCPVYSTVTHTATLGYVIINVQVEGIPSYYEEQVALVILNVTQLGLKVLVILGTPTIHWLCHQMKESKIQTALEECQHTLLSYEASGMSPYMPGPHN